MSFEDLIRSLLRDAFPGVWQQDRLCIPARADVFVPHIHGRVPDLIEFGDLPIPEVGDEPVTPCESTSVWFNPIAPAPQETMKTQAVPGGEERQIGAPLVQVVSVNSNYIIVRNWQELQHSVRLVTMSRQGVVPITDNDDLGKLGVNCDFMSDKVGNITDPTDVDFTDLTTYAFKNVNKLEGKYLANRWFWDFGDGNTSTSQNPTNTYTGEPAATKYTVSLTVTFLNGKTCTVIKPDLLTMT